MTQRGPALVRIALFSLLFGAFALALVTPAEAGTEAAPEIQDPEGDQKLGGQAEVNDGGVSASTDVVAAWVEETNATHVTLIVKTQAGPATTNNVNGVVTLYDHNYAFSLTVGGTAYTASLRVDQTDGVSVGGVAASGTIDQDKHYAIMVVPKASIGNPAAGATATALSVQSTSEVFTNGSPLTITDRAPDSGAGLDYTFTGGGGSTGTPGDSDGDGLNDTCEQTYFGGLNSTHNATEDADNDGLTNGQECALGTDPTKADTDGDGTNDKEDSAPTDPTKGGTTSGSHSNTGSSSGSKSSTSSSSTGTGSRSTSTTSDGDVKNLSDAVEKLKADAGYLGFSAGGLVAVLVLAILALAVRWSL